MNILVACEESQRVCLAFREKGHNAFSCDILDCSGNYPQYHIKGDVLPLLNGDCTFNTMDGKFYTIIGKWDMIIAFPPCTFLALTQNWCYNIQKYGADKVQKREIDRSNAINFFLQFTKTNCDKVAIENPVGCMSTIYQKPTQIIQPYYFGDNAKKLTCLWLKGLPELVPTNIVDYGEVFEYKDKNGRVKKYPKWLYNCLGKSKEERQRIRSKTFQGVAKAMAEQWG